MRHRPLTAISCGVADFAPADDAHAFIRRADEALYAAKRNGRNRVETGA
ncbi:MAG: diguanylate cyclase [Thiohalocapsa sp.]